MRSCASIMYCETIGLDGLSGFPIYTHTNYILRVHRFSIFPSTG